MSILTAASAQSAYRGYEYFREKKVLLVDEIEDGIFHASVAGSDDHIYDVTMDVAHPRRSKCNCPHADGRRVVCKHIVAAYFTVFPEEADNYWKELNDYWEEEEAQQEALEQELIQYVYKMKKPELQEAVLRLLFEGPEWQFDRFLEEHLGC